MTGPVAVITGGSSGIGFEAAAALTQGERPIQLFHSLHEVRRWLERARPAG